MPTVNDRTLVDRIIAGKGRYLDDPPVLLITEYTNANGGTAYGLDYHLPTAYVETVYVRNPKVIFRLTRR